MSGNAMGIGQQDTVQFGDGSFDSGYLNILKQQPYCLYYPYHPLSSLSFIFIFLFYYYYQYHKLLLYIYIYI